MIRNLPSVRRSARLVPPALWRLALPALWCLAACGGSAGTMPDRGAALSESEASFVTPVDTLPLVRVPDQSFGDARAVAVDPFGMLYVADAARHVVVKLTPTGALEAVLGGPGSRAGEFDGPSGIDATNGLVLIVADANNRRIQRFSRSHAFLGSIPLASGGDRASEARITYRQDEGDIDGFGTGRPGAVISSDSKETYAIDTDQNVVLKWDEDMRRTAVIGGIGAGPGSLAEPVDLALGPGSRLYVADRGRRAVVVFDEFGSFIRILGENRMTGVRAIAVGGDNVVVGRKDRLTWYGADGTLIGSIAIDLDEELVDLALDQARGGSRTLFVLTSSRLYRAPFPATL